MRCFRAVEEDSTSTDEDILANGPSSPWKKITSLICSRVVEEEAQETMRDQISESLSPGFLFDHPFLGCAKPLIIPSTTATSTSIARQQIGVLNIFIQWVKTPPGSPVHQSRTPLPGFTEITQSLEGDDPPAWPPV